MSVTVSAKPFPELTGSKSEANSLHLPILMLTLISAGAHGYLAAQPEEELRLMFLLNSLGYLGLVTVFLLPRLISFHHIISGVMIGYTILTIILWLFLGSPSEGKLDPFDLLVKAIELSLVIVLFQDRRGEKSGA
jgi:hypothetical protein